MGSIVNFTTTTITAATVATTAETVIATLNNVSTSLPGQVIRFDAQCDLTTSAATTTVTWRIRRTSLTGTAAVTLGPTASGVAASSRGTYDIEGTDSPGESSGPYVLTVQFAGASGAATINAVILQANIGG